MPRKFIYGPGLPGYGTKGVDGSTGLAGLATYFSAYDGNSDSITIKGKIIANKELFSNDVLLPGYPSRVYQTGDIFIDKNARVFEIDFAESNLYADTGIFLNTSGFFDSGPLQTLSPGFQRYSNKYATDKIVVDSVYANSVGNYTAYPVSLYDNQPLYFGRVNYIGSDILPDLNGWYPFEVWTIGQVGADPSNNAIGLARRGTLNEWHFGNYDNGNLGDTSLYLDFQDVYMPGLDSGGVGTNIVYIDNATGRLSYGGAAAGLNWGGTTTDGAIGFYTTAGGSLAINRDSSLLWNNTLQKLNIRGNSDSFGNIEFSKNAGLTASISSSIINTGNGVKLAMYTSNMANSSSPYKSGDVSIFTGNGSTSLVAAPGGASGSISILVGNGGSGYSGASAGTLILKSGNSGDTSNGAVTSGLKGGGITLIAGNGGNITNGSNTAGAGGDVSILGGFGYSTSAYSGGQGGNIYLTGGKGGVGATNDGAGGDIRINGGLNYTGSSQGILYIQNNLRGLTRIGGDLDVDIDLNIDGSATIDGNITTGANKVQFVSTSNSSIFINRVASGNAPNFGIFCSSSLSAGAGGDFTLMAGGSQGSGQNGGDVSIFGGYAAGGSNAGGNIYLSGGFGQSGGNIFINAGEGSSTDGGVYIGSTTAGVEVASGQAKFASGTESLPSLAFAADGNTGIFRSAADRIAFSLNGTKRFEFLYDGSARMYASSDLIISSNVNSGSVGDKIVIKGGNSISANGGPLYLEGGDWVASGSGYTGGPVWIKSGKGDSTSTTGSVEITTTADSDFCDSGNISISTGTGSISGRVAGNITLDCEGSTRGNIIMQGINSTATTTGMEYLMVDTAGFVWRDSGTPSDIRLKTIISPLENDLQKISSLSSIYFKFNEFCKDEVVNVDEEIHMGLIAQEVEKVYPSAVQEFKGNNDINYKKIDYASLVPSLFSAIKELNQIIEKQQEQINKLLEINNLK